MKILIINGGGIFGMIPTTFFNYLEIKDMRNHVDVLSGTSIGGIISLYYAQGKSPSTLYDVFKQGAPEIFKSSWLRNLNPFSSKYSAENIEYFLKQNLKGNLGSLQNIYVVVPSLDFKNEKPKVYDNIIKDSDLSVLLWEIGRATSAAPTYFPPYNGQILLDGGIVENSPVMTVSTAIKAKLNVPFNEMEVFVMGTGQTLVKSKTTNQVSKWTPVDWLRGLLVPFVTKSNEIASQYWGSKLGFKKFIIFDPVIIHGDIDDASQITSGELEKKCEPYRDMFIERWSCFIK